MVPRVGNETLCPLGVTMGNAVSVTRVWSIHIKTQPVGWRQPMTSLPERPLYKGCRENTSSTSFVWSLHPQCLVPHLGNHGYIRNLRRSPSWELRTASPRGRYGHSFLGKRDRRERSFFIEKSSQCMQISPSRTIACVFLAQTKNAKIVCVIEYQIARTRIHTLLKCLASARYDNRQKIVLLSECTLQTKQSVKTKEVDDVFSWRPLYCGRAGSDVIGCRRPTGCVFICMLQTRVTLTVFPIATPRGLSSKFPWRGTRLLLEEVLVRPAGGAHQVVCVGPNTPV